jgi:O-antigen/teichoic acid export membrane protein
VRGLVRRSYLITVAVSVPAAAVVFMAAPWLAERFSGLPDQAVPAFRWAAVTIPFAALAFTAMGATRGMKIMRYTLFAQWITQPVGWVLLTLALWAVVTATAAGAGAAFMVSWAAATVVAGYGWMRERRRLPHEVTGEGIAEEHTGSLLRFGALRAPGTLFAQLIFFTDFYVLSAMYSRLGPEGADQVGIYGGVLRAGQSLFLFLTSVSLTFSPFVADLHHRGERERLDDLYKRVTRWALTATIPVLLVLAVLPGPVLRVFGDDFGGGDQALRILIVGMIVPVMVGTVGFILIMAGRTGWDLVVYLGGVVIDVGLALLLARPEVLGIRGAAIAQACTLTVSALARLFLVRRFLGIWPFDAAAGTLACKEEAVAFRTSGETYAINEAATRLGFRRVDVIVRLQRGGPPTNPLSRVRQEDRQRIFRQSMLCEKFPAPDSVARCKAELRDGSGLSPAELTQIEVEGRERVWPPLALQPASLDALMKAGLKLCGR